MAVKKSAAPKKSAAKAAPKKASAAPKKASAVKAKATAPKAKKAAKKAPAAPAKLSSSQSELLKKISGTGEGGYLSDKKNEERTLEALRERKLIKRGAKDKEKGKYRYTISNAGKKHPESQPAGGASTPPSAPPTP
jgi:hypothetical protein